MTMTFEEVQDFLTGAADGIPPEITQKLNGGIILVPDTKPHPESIGGDLFILGEYHHDPRGLGRYITIYYGSFCRVCGDRPRGEQEKRLREVLNHELVHHLENLAGDKSLEIQDAVDLGKYRRKHERGRS